MRPFEYTNPETVDEAIALLRQNGHDRDSGLKPLAGGTDLLTLMKADVMAPSHLVNIKRLAELPCGIEDTSEGLTLGALTTLASCWAASPPSPGGCRPQSANCSAPRSALGCSLVRPRRR